MITHITSPDETDFTGYIVQCMSGGGEFITEHFPTTPHSDEHALAKAIAAEKRILESIFLTLRAGIRSRVNIPLIRGIAIGINSTKKPEHDGWAIKVAINPTGTCSRMVSDDYYGVLKDTCKEFLEVKGYDPKLLDYLMERAPTYNQLVAYLNAAVTGTLHRESLRVKLDRAFKGDSWNITNPITGLVRKRYPVGPRFTIGLSRRMDNYVWTYFCCPSGTKVTRKILPDVTASFNYAMEVYCKQMHPTTEQVAEMTSIAMDFSKLRIFLHEQARYLYNLNDIQISALDADLDTMEKQQHR